MAAQEDSPITAAADRSESTTLLVAKVTVSFTMKNMQNMSENMTWNKQNMAENMTKKCKNHFVYAKS